MNYNNSHNYNQSFKQDEFARLDLTHVYDAYLSKGKGKRKRTRLPLNSFRYNVIEFISSWFR